MADSVETFCHYTIDKIEGVYTEGNTDLLYEVADIKAWSHLGMYFANKLRAAVEYQKYLNTQKIENLNSSIQWLEKATANWHELVLVTEEVYEPVPLMHATFRKGDEFFHWSKIEEQVIEELNWLKDMIEE